MRLQLIRGFRGCLVSALLLSPSSLLAATLAANEPARPAASAPIALDAAMAAYRLKLEEYTRARQKYEQAANAYWNTVAEKRRTRTEKRRGQQEIVLNDYVLTQPPVYSGPAEPVSPEKVVPESAPPPPTQENPGGRGFSAIGGGNI
jgi:hypothetical protein